MIPTLIKMCGEDDPVCVSTTKVLSINTDSMY